MDRRHEIEALVADVLPRLEALREDSMGEIREAQGRADANVSRHEEAREELGGVEARLTMLRAEEEGLPVEHSRAVLADDVEEELRVKDRFSSVSEEIGELEERSKALAAEVRRLNPRGSGHPADATMHHLGRAAGVAHGARADLEGLRDRLTRALDATVRPVSDKHDALKGTVWQLGHDRDWAMSPVGRGGMRA